MKTDAFGDRCPGKIRIVDDVINPYRFAFGEHTTDKVDPRKWEPCVDACVGAYKGCVKRC